MQNFEEGGVSPTHTNPVGTFLRESVGVVSRHFPHLHSISYQQVNELCRYRSWLLRYSRNSSRGSAPNMPNLQY